MKSFLAFVLVLLYFTTSTAAKDCAVSGLPEKNNPDASVTIMRVDNVTSLHLSCRCSLHSPMWDVKRLDDWPKDPETVKGPIRCEDNGGPCTPVARSFISQQSPGVYTFIDHTFTIDQTTVLKCYKITGSSDSPDETVIIYFNEDEEELEVPTVATTELLESSASTESPSPTETSSSLYISSTATDEPSMSISVTSQRQPVATPNESPTTMSVTTQRQPDTTLPDDITSLDPSMPSEMSLINTIENELGKSALYLLPIVLALVVMVVVLFGCLLLLKYKRRKVTVDMEKSEPEKESNPADVAKQEIQLSSHFQESRLRSNSNTYVTFTLSPSMHQRAVLEAASKSCDSLTNLKQAGLDGSSNPELCNSQLALTIPLSLCMQGSSQQLRASETSPSVDNRTITSDSTVL